MAKKCVASLSVDELCSYLLVKLPDLEGETIEAFRFHKVNGETFLQLTDDDIRELTARLGERKAIKRLIDSSPEQHLVTEVISRTVPHPPGGGPHPPGGVPHPPGGGPHPPGGGPHPPGGVPHPPGGGPHPPGGGPHPPGGSYSMYLPTTAPSNYATSTNHQPFVNLGRTPPSDPSKGAQATAHGMVQSRAPLAAHPHMSVNPRVPSATPTTLQPCGLLVTPPSVQTRGLLTTPPTIPSCMLSATPPTIPSCVLSTTPITIPSCIPAVLAGSSSSGWIKSFKIPDFSFRTQQALKNGVITKGASSDIVTYIAHQIWTHTKYPTSEEYTEVCRELVTQYPVLKDATGSGYVSWKRRLQQKFKNLRRPNRGSRVRCREKAVGVSGQVGVADEETGVADDIEGHEIDYSESETDDDDKSNVLSGNIYSLTPPHLGASTLEHSEPPRKKMKESPDHTTTLMQISANSQPETSHESAGDGFNPLRIEEMSTFYNESSTSPYQDGWSDVKIKMPALEET